MSNIPIERILHERDVAALPVYDPRDVAISLRASPISIAAGLRPGPKRAVMSEAEHQLRQAQMDYYVKQQAHGHMHTYDYDPCRSK